MTPPASSAARLPDPDAVAELETLRARLGSRRSIVHVRRALYALLFAFLTGFATWNVAKRFGFDLEAGTPSFWLAASAGALLVIALVSLLVARRLMRGEDRDFARLKALRSKLGLDG